MTTKDHSWSDEPVCPYCGHEATNAWEWGIAEEDGEHECGECERTYTWTRHVLVRWNTQPKAPQ